MDYPEQRQNYLKVYQEFLKDIKLTEGLVIAIKQFSPILWESNEIQKEETIKSYILLELTKNRQSCDVVIKILENSGVPKNAHLAQHLRGFNTSPGHQTYRNDIYLPVIPVLSSEVTHRTTLDYPMTKNPRGKAVIINVVPNEVQLEALRFNDIFEQLLFEPKMHFSLTTQQIIDELTTVANDLGDRGWERRDQALIVMIITHGRDEKITGANYSRDRSDIRPIHEIVDLFAKVRGTAKMFFFTCCRNITEDHRNPMEMKCSKKDGTDTNTDTFVFYSSAEGYPTKKNRLYTHAGKKLSESIAQYAHRLHLTEIINKTNLAMKEDHQDKKPQSMAGCWAPENKQKCVVKNVYFNPGWHEGM